MHSCAKNIILAQSFLAFITMGVLFAEGLNAPPPLAIRTKTALPAPANPDLSRKTVGVFEDVTLSTVPSVAATWTASGGTLESTTGPTATINWEAPDAPVAGTDVIFTATANGQTATTTIKVIPPNGHHYHSPSPAGEFSAILQVDILPMSVNFEKIDHKEIGGPATSPTDDFAGLPPAFYDVQTLETNFRGNLAHYPSTTWGHVVTGNEFDAGDWVKGAFPSFVAAHYAVATGEYVPERNPAYGSFTWVIPNRYTKKNQGGDGTFYCNILQVFTYIQDSTLEGTATLTKGDFSAITAP